MQNVYEHHLFYNKRAKCKPQTDPLGVLVGCVGTGKTTCFNLITNRQLKISDGGESATRNVFSSSSGYGNKFSILDTPGTQNDEDKLAHAINLRMALIERPLSRIFLFIKFDRHGAMIKNLSEQLFMLQEWNYLITIIVTHWDRKVTPKDINEYEMAKKKLMDNTDIVDSFIFIGIEANPESACEAIFQNLCIYLPTQLEISDKQFQYRFDLYSNMGKVVDKQIFTFRERQSSLIQEIKRYNQDDKDEFMHACIVMISQIAEQMIEEFTKEYCKQMQEVDNYLHYMKLKQALTPMVEQVRKEASGRMSYSLYDQREPKNMLKACPNCKIIWVKVSGCDGETNCGNRLSGDYLFDRKPSGTLITPKFKFSWKDTTFRWIKELVQYSKPIAISDSRQKPTAKGVGCGSSFVWGNQPAIDNTILNELKDAGVTDFLINQPQNKDIQEMIEQQQKVTKIYYLR